MPVPSDIYRDDVDFTALALRYQDFAKKLKSNRQLDFSDPESVRELTKALLDRDFSLTINLPEDRLCPPVPNRFNYIVFLQRLLDSSQRDYSEVYQPKRRVIGLDIGTGASAIYPLLGCRQRESWLFLATEIDEKSRRFAGQNITNNDLSSRIKLIASNSSTRPLIPSDEFEAFERVDFLMTNPPFYTSEEELEKLAKQKARPPNSACTGAPVEMICPGGEVFFVSQIIEESLLANNRAKIQWFSSMLGKLGSVSVVTQKLRDLGCTNYAITEFVQGQRTRRWCIAWSWQGLRPSQLVARGTDAIEKHFMPFPTELELVIMGSPDEVIGKLNEEIAALDGMQWQWRQDLEKGVGRSQTGDVWSRHARRRQKKLELEQKDSMDVEKEPFDGDDEEPKFAVKISYTTSDANVMADTDEVQPSKLHLRWLQGQDSTVFESFHGWLKRKLSAC